MDLSATGSCRSLRFCTDQLPERGRIAATREILSRAIWRFDFEPAPATRFFARGRMQSIPGLALVEVETSEGRTQRTAQHIVDDQYLFNVCVAGSTAVSQCGREVSVGPGDAVLTMGAERAAMQFSASRFLSFGISAQRLAALVPDAEDRVARPIAGSSDALKLLIGYAGVLQEGQIFASPQLRHAAVSHVHELVALALGAVRRTGETSGARGLRAARLNAIKGSIEHRLGQEEISIVTVAAAHRLPVRYVQRLFEEDGSTFTEFVLERRLARAYRLLGDPQRAELKIGTLALEAGFTNISYFSQAFRRRFGSTPSEARLAAVRH